MPDFMVLFGFRLAKTQAAVAIFPLAALFQQLHALKTLQNIALGGNLAGILQTRMLTHVLSPETGFKQIALRVRTVHIHPDEACQTGNGETDYQKRGTIETTTSQGCFSSPHLLPYLMLLVIFWRQNNFHRLRRMK